MIARLRGVLDSTGADWAIVDVHGVGYLVSASSRTLTALGPTGGTVALFIEMQVREDSMQLFGFVTEDERDWFRLLQSVQGVGARVALSILSVLSPSEVQTAVARQDKASVARANGVGPKLAARIVNELKDKAGGIALGIGPSLAGTPAPALAVNDSVRDALSALANLGFRPAEASRAVAEAQVDLGEGAAFGDLVRVALKKSAH